ncbi:uncharacterized protein YktA (UPF0223 family) [Bacillus tianshenii]|uniref:UPF0223 protein JOC95_003657 n=1 Tax=Sutcliffiella tianshenii TaxID=1463404 RepID=A0ABS2P456_9BACI|nr:UPF0223 family protein [Bacillus tianshenii]MBM7621749.1 uncharacterized protein YktA (UPF0223 family) [Bacillus tianshenii]
MDFSYPISYDWTTDEIVDVIAFYEAVEQAYDKGIERDHLMSVYRRFKEIVPGKAEERNLANEYEELSGFSAYQTIKKAKSLESGDRVKM